MGSLLATAPSIPPAAMAAESFGLPLSSSLGFLPYSWDRAACWEGTRERSAQGSMHSWGGRDRARLHMMSRGSGLPAQQRGRPRCSPYSMWSVQDVVWGLQPTGYAALHHPDVGQPCLRINAVAESPALNLSHSSEYKTGFFYIIRSLTHTQISLLLQVSRFGLPANGCLVHCFKPGLLHCLKEMSKEH